MTQPESKRSLDIQKMLKSQGAWVWKVHGNEYTPSGIPDICGVYKGQFIAIETKMAGNKLSAIQEYRIELIRAAGGLVCAPCFSVAEAKTFLEYVQRHLRGGDTNAAVYVRTHYGVDAVFPK